MIKRTVAVLTYLWVIIDFISAQKPLPTGIEHFPETLGVLADSGFYRECVPMFSSVNMAADSTGKHNGLFVLTMDLFQSKSVEPEEDYTIDIFPTQALLFSVSNSGVFPRWRMNFKDDTAATLPNVLGIFRYHPEYKVYSLARNAARSGYDNTLIILDSTFHEIAHIPGAVDNLHDFQLLKTPDGKWQVIAKIKPLNPYFCEDNQNYAIISKIYNENKIEKELWKCGPTVESVDTDEWEHVYDHCDAEPHRDISSNDIFHANSWQAFTWSADSLLVVVSEKNDDKVRFWWLVNSSGAWAVRNMLRLGRYSDKYNDFTFPDDSGFQISGGHNFRILCRNGNGVLATYYDDEECDTIMPARGLILSLDFQNKTCRILQETSQGTHASGRGSFQIMLKETDAMTPESILRANRCVEWGGWGYAGGRNAPRGYFPGSSERGYWEISIMTPHNQPIVDITITDLGNYTHHKVLNNSEYQAEAYYNLPIPRRPIHYHISGNEVNLTTDFVHPTWITGDTIPSITVTMPAENDSVRVWVRGKTDETMVGELWENILVSPIMKKKQ